MDSKLTRVVIKGYKSIRDCDITLDRINVLIGPNGAGKSNFISAFSLVQKIINKDLQYTVAKCGASTTPYNGLKVTKKIDFGFYFGNNGYCFSLEPTDDERLVFADESFYWNVIDKNCNLGRGHFESKWDQGVGNGLDDYVKPVLAAKSWRVYHFHDTSRESPIKLPCDIYDSSFLHQDAGNIAAYLLRLKNEFPRDFARITHTVRRINNLFDEFVLEPNSNGLITLRWKKKGIDAVMGPGQLSDGTIRFIALSTLLLQPMELLPKTVILDEPELGLYPQAIVLLGEMIRLVASKVQVIVSTQSVELVDEFEPSQIIVVNDDGDGTILKRLDEKALESWLEDEYSLGMLWKKNLLRGD